MPWLFNWDIAALANGLVLQYAIAYSTIQFIRGQCSQSSATTRYTVAVDTPSVSAIVFAGSPEACMRRARAAFSESRALGRPTCCPRALRASRPDAELTLIAKPQFLPLLESWGVADQLHALPPQGLGYFVHFWRLRRAYPDTWLLFTNSFRGDLEAWLAGCRQRFGLVRPGKRRPLLSHAYVVPAGFDERTHHQLELWENFLRHFGLTVAPDRSPVLSPPLASPKPGEGGSPPASFPIGLICGSENNPAKRWPVSHWRALIELLPAERFVLFGTANDAPITSAIAGGFGDRVENLAGRTTLPEYSARLRACRLLVTNDTGGMHLANALGVPLIALFGPTNPVRTGPVFSAPVTILQPPGCAPTGGGSLADLSAQRVVADVPIGDERR